MRRTTAPCSLLRAALALLALCAAPIASCGDDGKPAPDGGALADRGASANDARPSSGDGGGSGGSVFDTSVRKTCEKLIASCQTANDPMGQPWSKAIVPWTQQACEQMAACFVAATTEKCFERLATYYVCMEKAQPFACNGCLNQWQFIQGACPCLKQCNPACP